jgi:hypothetical protein
MASARQFGVMLYAMVADTRSAQKKVQLIMMVALLLGH